MMCFSDNTIPDHYFNFMHNSQYFRMYVKDTTVYSVKERPDFSSSGQWEVVTECEGHALGKEHKIMVGSISDPGVFCLLYSQLSGDKEFVSWQQDLDDSIKPTQQTWSTVIHWSEGGKEVFISGSFNKWSTKILLIKRNLTDLLFSSTSIMTLLPSWISLLGENQYKCFVVGQWVHDPSELMVTSQVGMINNLTLVKKSDFEVFDALKLDSWKAVKHFVGFLLSITKLKFWVTITSWELELNNGMGVILNRALENIERKFGQAKDILNTQMFENVCDNLKVVFLFPS
ncbi:5'-AMP-activated protein kinase subunit beta-2 [Sciurus carolinensis]|uniref:Flavin-containing monooxygenase n=1 Tax=Sciurus carolinensis TaxID=30640 RepID=A0AA41N3I9_SCICA|nr:5'-AMP-activated protein kinase subunit beta-2 [Sciurus carolinensis]